MSIISTSPYRGHLHNFPHHWPFHLTFAPNSLTSSAKTSHLAGEYASPSISINITSDTPHLTLLT
ncbi:protein of unknown function (plasmid) [Pararobbsia alpina]